MTNIQTPDTRPPQVRPAATAAADMEGPANDGELVTAPWLGLHYQSETS